MFGNKQQTQLFDRRLRVKVTSSGRDLEFPNELRVTCTCNKSIKNSANSTTVEIFNLKREKEIDEMSRDSFLSVFAGYKDDVSLLSQSVMTRAWFSRQKTERVLNLDGLEGYDAFRKTNLSLSFAKNSNTNQVLKAVIKELNLPVRKVSTAFRDRFKTGYTYTGKALGVLEEMAEKNFFEFSVQNGFLVILGPEDFSSTTALEINEDDAFLEPPENIEDSGFLSQNDQPRAGVEFKILCKPEIEPGIEIKLNSREIKGNFRVEEVYHELDNKESFFTTEVKAFVTRAIPPSLGNLMIENVSKAKAKQDDLFSVL